MMVTVTSLNEHGQVDFSNIINMTPFQDVVSTSITTMMIPTELTAAGNAAITPLISHKAVEIFFFAAVRVAQLIIASFGVFSNIVNVTVYSKMGFAETSSITLTALSLTDLVIEMWLLLMAIGYRPASAGVDVPPLTVTLVHVLSPVSNSVLGYGSWVTAVISIERCLCIVFPMKIKSIFTVRRVFGLVMVILTIQMSSVIPHYATMQLTYVTSPATNRSGLVFSWTEYSLHVESITLLASFTLPSIICFSIVLLCTIFLVIKLNQSAKWRQSTSNSAPSSAKKDGGMSSKETRVVRTVALICAIYIVCFAPNVFTITAMAVVPDFHQTDPYLGNLAAVCFTAAYPFQSISSAVNIFVYYKMSTKYRETLNQLFCLNKENQ
ncbi:chemosensory receptor A [Elysia marginata]|uniref:Chemosensory receptor A n=1 Tax=Elysia marginata TaxID=1093978 RepID=A0AAV4GC47_9GAST|nr:chemosensory receptor A [Elysia marginata]